MDNNLAFSPNIHPRDIIQWENSISDTFKRNHDYQRMFLMKQIACDALISQGKIKEALKRTEQILSLAKQMHYNVGIAIAHLAIGNTYSHTKMYEEAIEEFEYALQILKKEPATDKLQEWGLIQLYPILIKKHEITKAKEYLNYASAIYNKGYYNKFFLYAFSASYNLAIGNYKEVKKQIEEATYWYKIFPFVYYGTVLNYLQAEHALKTGHYKEAANLYNEIYSSDKPTRPEDNYIDRKTTLANIYIKLRNYDKASEVYNEINIARDSIDEQDYSLQVNLRRTKYQVDSLALNNQSQRNKFLSRSISYSIFILVIAIFSIIHLGRINRLLVQSKKKLEKARIKMENSIRTKSLFLSNMSHEIRTPLNALAGFSAILTEPGIDNEMRKQCNEIIIQNSNLLLKLIDDVVDLSSLDTGKMQFRFGIYDAVAICRNVIETVSKIKQTAAETLFQSNLKELQLYTDETRLQQLLFNLLINATKFTNTGSIILTLELQSEKEALFIVTDTGCGISLEKQKYIFNRFEKLNESSQGSGLGLFICQLIVERFGGEIWIDPKYKGGSRFLFTHPLQPKI